MFNDFRIVVIGAAALISGMVCAEESGPAASVTIDADAPSVPISPMLRGGFIEHFHRQIYGGLFEPGSPLADARGYRTDVVAALKELKLSVVRWPGGCFASGYHWKAGVGAERKPVFDMAWGVEEPNTFGTDEFVAWCRLVGCEPYICANAGNGTPEEMRDWVVYCNKTNDFKVSYWSIGNENWGGHEIGAKSPREWAPLAREWARMSLEADPGIHLVAAATPDKKWTLPLLKAAGNSLDFVAIHEYWLPCWQDNLTPDYLTCIMASEGPEATIGRVVELLDRAGRRGRVRIAFDEWNLRGWHHPGFPRKEVCDNRDAAVAELIRCRDKNDMASQYTMADAVFTASFLNACIRHAADVGMANIAPIVNARGPLYVYPGGLVKRTTFHVLSLYANALEARAGKVEVVAPPLAQGDKHVAVLDAVATVDDSGKKWALVLMNRHPSEALACVVTMKDTALEGTYSGLVLSGDSPEAFNDVEHPDRVVPQQTMLTFSKGVVSLPPHSVAIVRLSAP